MTRETKIGLLVGLAFIIVIGILLSDHLSSSSEPPSATLVQAGTNLRQQVATPAGTQSPMPQVTAPISVTPTNPIATQRDLTPPTVPSAIVQVGPVTQANNPPIIANKPIETAEPPVTMVSNTPEEKGSGETSAAPVELTNNGDPSNPLSKVAAAHGEQLISPNGQPLSPLTAPKNFAATIGGKDYVVQPGDTISKLATRFLGSNTKFNRDQIIKANPSLTANPDKLIVGKSYKMPTATNASASATPAPAVAPLPETAPIAKTAPVQLASDSVIYYIVKPGDSLWKIASEQLGMGGKGVASIKELNKETLNGGDTVTVDMKLRMPGKAVASAS